MKKFYLFKFVLAILCSGFGILMPSYVQAKDPAVSLNFLVNTAPVTLDSKGVGTATFVSGDSYIFQYTLDVCDAMKAKPSDKYYVIPNLSGKPQPKSNLALSDCSKSESITLSDLSIGSYKYSATVYANNDKNKIASNQITITLTKDAKDDQNNTSSQKITDTVPPIDNPFGDNTLLGVVANLIKVLFGIIIMAAIVVIIISGFRMVTGGDNPEQLKKAKQGIIWALIGLVVSLMSYAIVQIIQNILG